MKQHSETFPKPRTLQLINPITKHASTPALTLIRLMGNWHGMFYWPRKNYTVNKLIITLAPECHLRHFMSSISNTPHPSGSITYNYIRYHQAWKLESVSCIGPGLRDNLYGSDYFVRSIWYGNKMKINVPETVSVSHSHKVVGGQWTVQTNLSLLLATTGTSHYLQYHLSNRAAYLVLVLTEKKLFSNFTIILAKLANLLFLIGIFTKSFL